MNKVLPVHRLLDAKTHVAYNKYLREGKLPQRHKAGDREEMRLILSTICKHVAEGMTEAPGGVLIKNLGYFFNWKCPRKMPYHITKAGESPEERMNFHTDHHMYFPTFVPQASNMAPRSTWSMDKMFDERVGQRVNKQLRNGFKYHNYLHTLKL